MKAHEEKKNGCLKDLVKLNLLINRSARRVSGGQVYYFFCSEN